MTVISESATVAYTGDGSTTVFAVPFRFLLSGDLKVYVAGSLVVSGYTVTGAGNPSGGSITFSVAPVNAASISIDRDPPITQLAAYANQDRFPAATHESALDKLTMIAQRHKLRLDGVDARVDEAEDRLDGLDVDVSAQDTRLDGHDTRLDIAEGRLDGHDADIADHESRIVSAEDVAQYVADINAMVPAAVVNAVEAGIAADEGAQQAIADEIFDKLSFTQSGAGASARTTDAKLKEVAVSIGDYDGSPAASGATNSAALAAAQVYLNSLGGGFIDIPPGEYTLANVGPGLVDGASGATSWDNRYCFRFIYNNIFIRMSPGSIMKLGNSESAHVIQFGQREGATVTVSNCGVIGGAIDGNRANQSTPDATLNHQNGIDVATGCTQLLLRDVNLHDCMYYGVGFQGGAHKDCTVEKLIIEDVGADGIDVKDNDGTCSGNKMNNITVRRFGMVAALSQQAGVNFRGGWDVSGVTVLEYDADRHGIRHDVSTVSGAPAKLDGFYCAPSSMGTTKGLYANIVTSSTEPDFVAQNGVVVGAATGVDNRRRYAKISTVTARACGTGFLATTDQQYTNVTARNCTVVGYKIEGSNNLLANASAYNCLLGANIDAASTLSAFRGGVFSSNTTNITDAGAQTAFSNVVGVRTDSTGTANVPIDSTGEKTVTIAHSLDFTPSLVDVVLTLQRNTVVADYVLGYMNVYMADATNVYCKVRVMTASATGGAVVTLMARCIAKKQTRQ